MKIYTIENETNNITVHATAQEADAVANAERFRNEAGLAKLAVNWPSARLVEIWNSLPGATPVKKFTDRKKAVTRIWTAIQNLAAAVPAEAVEGVVAQAPAEVAEILATEPVGKTAIPAASEEANLASIETPAVATPVAPQTPDVAPSEAPAKKKATPAKKAPKAPKQPAAAKPAREGSKTETIIALMKQPGGATLQAIMEAAGWQAHSVRGFVSGTLGKKMGLTVVSTKRSDGERVYTLTA